MTQYRQTAMAPMQTATGYTPGAFTAAVVIPACRAAITGAGVAALGGLGAWGVGYGPDSLGVAAFCGVAAFLASWLAWTRGPVVTGYADAYVGADPLPGRGGDRIVLLNPPNDTAEPDAGGDFGRFVQSCETDTSMRRLRGLGFPDGDIARWRDALIRAGWARWNGPDKRGGWQLTGSADDVLAAMGG